MTYTYNIIISITITILRTLVVQLRACWTNSRPTLDQQAPPHPAVSHSKLTHSHSVHPAWGENLGVPEQPAIRCWLRPPTAILAGHVTAHWEVEVYPA